MTEPLTLLCVHPHPDDESIACGGLLAASNGRGIRTVVVTCTDGAEGENLAGIDLGTEDLLSHRRRELCDALEVLRVDRHHDLGYRDSGMDGTDANEHPDSFHRADLDEAARRLAEIVRAERPQVVVSDDEHGSYGHPDHVRAHRVTGRAIELAADPDADVEGAPWTVDRWLVHAMGHERLLAFHRALLAEGLASPFGDGPIVDPSELGMGVPDDQITVHVDIRHVFERKRAAMRAHRSQIGEDSFFFNVPDDAAVLAFASEQFVLQAGRAFDVVPASDVFDGIAGIAELDRAGRPDTTAFRDVLGRFPTGVTVLTTEVDGTPHGMTVNAFTSVSLDPPLVLVCVEETAVMAGLLDRSGRFGVSVLAADQVARSVWFADSDRPTGADAFAGIPVARSETGVPLLADAVAWLDCRIHAVHDGGDHRIVVGEVVALGTGSGQDPLVFHRGAYGRFVEDA
ncbi:MAG: flavin reductase [Nitriliruptoraceae bacterium]